MSLKNKLLQFVPEVEIAFWAGILAPKGTDAEVVMKLNLSLNKTLSDPEVRSILSKQGIDPLAPGGPDSLGDRMTHYAKLYRDILKEIDLAPT